MTSTEQLLLDCLHQDPRRLDADRVAAVTAVEWDGVLKLAAGQRVRPMVLRRLTQPDISDHVPVDVRTTLKTSCVRIAQRNLDLHAELSRLLAAMTTVGIRVILLKGMHLATALYGNLALREIGDIDIMVPRHQIAEATALVLADGYTAASAFDIEVDIAVNQHVSRLHKPPHFEIEVHWTLSRPTEPYGCDPESLWARATPVGFFRGSAYALSPGDLLLHLCQHLSYQHRFEFGLRSLCDLAALLASRSGDLDWDEIVDRAEQSGLLAGTRLSLELGHRLLGASIPDSAARRLALTSLSSHVVHVASRQLLEVDLHSESLSSGHSALYDNTGVPAKWRHLTATVFRPLDEMRRMYPTVRVASWTWPFVYVLRCRDLFARHAWSIVRFAVFRERSLRTSVGRQRTLRAFLSTNRRSADHARDF